MSRYKRIQKIFLLSFLLGMITSSASPSRGTQNHTKLWLNADVIAPLSTADEKLKYYFEPRLQFIDDRYRIEETYAYLGPGYQITPHFIAIIGLAYVFDKSLNGAVSHEDRLFEQANWRLFENSLYELNSRTRLEERKNLQDPQIAVRFREKLSLRTQLPRWQGHSVVISDEIFLNLTHPKWLNTPTFDQNRFFIGLGTQLTKHTTWDIGYLGQYQYTTPKQYSNILYSDITVRM